MKTLILLLLALLPFGAGALDTGVSFSVYSTLEKSYVEINLEVAATSLTYVPLDSLRREGKVEVLILVTRGEEVANYQKYVLVSAAAAGEMPRALIDVKRLVLESGEYQLEVVCTDVNKPDNKDVFKAPLKVDIGTAMYLTQPQLLRSFRRDTSDGIFVKNGFYLEPLPFGFYDRDATRLAFYAELYYVDKTVGNNAEYLVRYFIEQDRGNGQLELISTGNQRRKARTVDALLVKMDIGQLESGNYQLTVEVRNNANELLGRRLVAFQRSNPYLNITEKEITDESLEKQFVNTLTEDELRFALRALSPLAAGADGEMLKNILLGTDLKPMRFYVFRHFVRQDPNTPEQAYRDYIDMARAVDNKFHSGFRYGFETDRGRTFIKYGKPDDLVHVEDDPAAPPYEIWVYYKFPKTNQSNVKFLFYNPTLAGDDMVLLHSNARGEIQNPRWERQLYSRNAGEEFEGDNYHDATRMQRNVNRNARVYFEDF